MKRQIYERTVQCPRMASAVRRHVRQILAHLRDKVRAARSPDNASEMDREQQHSRPVDGIEPPGSCFNAKRWIFLA